ncbi:MAG: MBOAT family protein [Ruminococcus sp.]|nr:MBOAT family protein [Ruminococcus sp.]
MVFSSLNFIFIFLPVFFLAYGIAAPKYKNLVLFAGSIIFYSMGVLDKPLYIPLFLLTVLVNFLIGELIENFRGLSKLWLVLGIVYNFWWLIFFKYTGFIFTNLNHLGASLTIPDIVLPIGISFYTFQNVSYIIDVYRKDTPAENSIVRYGAYISMFPQLIAGPIVKYKDVAQQLKNTGRHAPSAVEDGLKTFTIGLGYKVLIANQIGGLWSDISAIGFDSISTGLAWLGIFAYSFQLYFDFCGYSYMAIGLGRIMGFSIPENFRHPYMSLTVGEFWRRWHITLGTWFKEYIYIPLGGNRGGTRKTIRNLFVVWLFTGIWHGASWNFVLWGLVLLGFILLERFYIGDFLNKHPSVGHLYIILVIPVTWLLFAVTDLKQIGVYLVRLIPLIPHSGNVNPNDVAKHWGVYWKYFIAAGLLSTPLPEKLYKRFKGTVVVDIALLAVFWMAVYCMVKGLDDPFMYFRF